MRKWWSRLSRLNQVRIAGGLTAAVVLLVAAVWGVGSWLNSQNERSVWCDGTGLAYRHGADDECVGIADGSYVFHAEHYGIKRVQDLIFEQNEEGAGLPYVNIAVVLPFPWHGKGNTTEAAIQHQLEGAYAAQAIANKDSNLLHVKLIVVNGGYDNRAWESVAARLIVKYKMSELAAVIGLGPSVDNTERLARKLSAAGIPMTASNATADNLHGGDDGIKHLRRVTPSNRNEVEAILAFMRSRHLLPGQRETTQPNESNTVLVASGAEDDDYSRTLLDMFRKAIGNRVSIRTYKPGAMGDVSAIKGIASQICQDKDVAWVYFTGRSDDLRKLITEMGTVCLVGRTITVMSGDAASDLTGIEDVSFFNALKGPQPKVELLFSGLAHPDQWKELSQEQGSSPKAMYALATEIGLYGLDGDLTDGFAMMSHDAVALNIYVVGKVTQDLKSGASPVHVQVELDNGFTQAVPADPFCGASGPIGIVFDVSEGDEPTGNTVNKAIPVIQLHAMGKTSVAGHRPIFPMGSAGWKGKCGMPLG